MWSNARQNSSVRGSNELQTDLKLVKISSGKTKLLLGFTSQLTVVSAAISFLYISRLL